MKKLLIQKIDTSFTIKIYHDEKILCGRSVEI